MSNIEKLTKKILAFRDARDWKQFHNPKDVVLSLMLEAAELAEHFRWKTNEEIRKYVDKRKEDIADELADVLYWILLLSHDLDINLIEASAKKLRKNRLKYPIKKAKGRHTKYTEL